MKNLWITVALVVALSIGSTVPAMAEKITVEEVILAVLIDDFKTDDYSADITAGQGLAGEQRGTVIYRKTNKYRMTFTEDGNGDLVDKVVVSDGRSATLFDNDAGTVEHQDLGIDPMNMDFRALYYLSARSPILHFTFSDGSTARDKVPSNQYDLKLQGADLDISIKLDVARRVLLEKRVDLGAGKSITQAFSDFLLAGSVYVPGTQTLTYDMGTPITRVDVFSNYALNQDPSSSLFDVP